MDFTKLIEIVNQEFDGKNLNIEPGPFGSAQDPIPALLQECLKVESLVVLGATKPEADEKTQQVKSKGSITALGWKEPTSIEVCFTLVSATPQLVLKVQLNPAGSSWQFSDRYPKLKGSVFDDATVVASSGALFIFSSYGHNDGDIQQQVPSGLSFCGRVKPGGQAFEYLQGITGQVLETQAFGPIVEHDYGPDITIRLSLGATLDKILKDLHLPLEVSLRSYFQPDGSGSLACVDLRATFDWGPNQGVTISSQLDGSSMGIIPIRGDFEGLSLPGPADLVHWIGGDGNMLASLPPKMQSSTLLRISSLELGIATSGFNLAYVALELAALEGHGWEIIPQFFDLHDVRAQLRVTSPFSSVERSIDVVVLGDLDVPVENPVVQLEASATHTKAQGFVLGASLKEGSTFNLNDLVALVFPAVKDAPALIFDELGCTVATSSSPVTWSFDAAFRHPWQFAFGGNEHVTLECVALSLQGAGGRQGTSGQIEAQANVLGVSTDAVYDLTTGFRINAEFPDFDIDLHALAVSFADPSWPIPTWFPRISFAHMQLYIAINKQEAGGEGQSFLLVLRTNPTAFQVPTDLAVAVERAQGKWGFVAGALLDKSFSLEDAFPKLPEIFGALEFQQPTLVLCSLDNVPFDFSDLFPDFHLPLGAFKLRTGASFLAEIDLKCSDYAFLVKLLNGGHSKGPFTGQVLTRLFLAEDLTHAELDFIVKMKLPIVPGVFTMIDPTLILQVGNPFMIVLSASATLTVHNEVLEFAAGTQITSQSISFYFTSDRPWKKPFGLKFLIIDEVFVSFTVEEEGLGELAIGGAVELTLSDGTKDHIAVELAFIGDPPAPTAFIGCFDKPINFIDLVQNLAHVSLPAPARQVLNAIKLTRFGLYIVALPTPGSACSKCFVDTNGQPDVPYTYQPGLAAHGHLQFFDFYLVVQNLQVIEGKAIQADIRMSSINMFGAFTVTAADRTTCAPYRDPKGPCLFIDSSGSTSRGFLAISGAAKLVVGRITFLSTSIEAKLAPTGLLFSFSYYLVYGNVEVHCTISGPVGFLAGANVDLGFDYGPIHVHVGGGFDIRISAAGVYARIYLQWNLFGYKYVLWIVNVGSMTVDPRRYRQPRPAMELEGARRAAEPSPFLLGPDGVFREEDWQEKVRQQVLSQTDAAFKNSTVEQFVQAVKNNEMTSPSGSSTVKAVRDFYNAPATIAAKAAMDIHGRPGTPEQLAVWLYRPDNTQPVIYPPAQIAPALEACLAIGAVECAIILKTALELTNPNEAANALYASGTLYSKSEILPALKEPKAYGLSDAEARRIIDSLS